MRSREQPADRARTSTRPACCRRRPDPAGARGCARVSGSISAPTRGSLSTSGGKRSKVPTPTTRSPAPMANNISVVAGMSEMIRRGAAPAAWPRCHQARTGPGVVGRSRTDQQTGGHDAGSEETRRQTRRRSSHRKNGPPMIAVMTPTGTSIGENIVRAIRSQVIEERRAEQRRRGKHEAVSRSDHQADHVRDDDPDEPDGPGNATRQHRWRATRRRARSARRASRPRLSRLRHRSPD